MEIVVRGRNVEVPEHYRQHVEDKVGPARTLRREAEDPPDRRGALAREEPPPVGQLPARGDHPAGKGPVVRAEASGPDFYAALDLAAPSWTTGCAARPTAAASTTAGTPRPASGWPTTSPRPTRRRRAGARRSRRRRRPSRGTPARADRPREAPPGQADDVDQALHEMELVGHDFYLFQCADTGQPTVVYRRHAYDYGLIRLAPVARTAQRPSPPPGPGGRAV